MSLRTPLLVLLAGLACGGGDSPPPCGLGAVVGPSLLLSEFSQPGRTLAAPPARLPEQMVVRMVAGPAYSAIAGRADSLWVIGVNGSLPEGIVPGHGILVLDLEENPMGVLLYEGEAVGGAPILGSVNIGALVVPLIGIRVDPARIQEPQCPLFPDSLRS